MDVYPTADPSSLPLTFRRLSLSDLLGSLCRSPAPVDFRVFCDPQDYNKSHSVTAMKANPLGGSSMAKGIVLEKM